MKYPFCRHVGRKHWNEENLFTQDQGLMIMDWGQRTVDSQAPKMENQELELKLTFVFTIYHYTIGLASVYHEVTYQIN